MIYISTWYKNLLLAQPPKIYYKYMKYESSKVNWFYISDFLCASKSDVLKHKTRLNRYKNYEKPNTLGK